MLALTLNTAHTQQMSVGPPLVLPRKPSGVRVMIPAHPGGQALYTDLRKVNRGTPQPTYIVNPERELEMLNHCFDNMEAFMRRLQQAAEAQAILNQLRSKKKSRKSKKQNREEQLVTVRAIPPSEEDFVDIFQKIKYSFSLLDRLKSSITQPDSPELLHHVFVVLGLIVKATRGPEFGASVVSPALTSGAVVLLQQHLTQEEKHLWTSLGSNWTLPCLQLGIPVPSYTPVFLDGWQPQAFNASGQPLEDPIESHHKQDAFRESRKGLYHQTTGVISPTVQQSVEVYFRDGHGLPPETHYCCSYDFVARNSSELSVLQGETLQVIESSRRWWKCQNSYGQIGYIPFNILEPLSAVSNTERKNSMLCRESKYISYGPPSPTSPTNTGLPARSQSIPLPMQGDEGERVRIVNNELLQRLGNGRPGSVRPLMMPRTTDPSTPLHYSSQASEVQAWLFAKGFSQQTVQKLGVLTGPQLFTLNKDELCTVCHTPQEGARVYSQITVHKALLEDVTNTSELEKAMEKQKLKVEMKTDKRIL